MFFLTGQLACEHLAILLVIKANCIYDRQMRFLVEKAFEFNLFGVLLKFKLHIPIV